MKTLITAAIFLTSLAHACPDLSGHYSVCRSKKNVLIEGTDLIVSEHGSPEKTHFKLSMIPDGSSQREETMYFYFEGFYEDSWEVAGTKYERKTYARCYPDRMNTLSIITANGRQYLHEKSIFTKKGNVLTRESSGWTGDVFYEDTLTCN